LLHCLRVLARPSAPSRREVALLGVLVGLAALTKATGLLLAPIVATVLLARRAGAENARWPRVGSAATALGVALVVAGWFYARNWIHFGKPFVGGWDAAIGVRWWQDPSYRVPEQLFRFGFSLHTPI